MSTFLIVTRIEDEEEIKIDTYKAPTWQEALGQAKLTWILEGMDSVTYGLAQQEAAEGGLYLEIRRLGFDEFGDTRLEAVV